MLRRRSRAGCRRTIRSLPDLLIISPNMFPRGYKVRSDIGKEIPILNLLTLRWLGDIQTEETKAWAGDLG